jgi:hypothetical protein
MVSRHHRCVLSVVSDVRMLIDVVFSSDVTSVVSGMKKKPSELHFLVAGQGN